MDRRDEAIDKPVRRKRHLDYDALAEAYEDALARIEILEDYLVRMMKLCDFRRYEP